MSTTPSNIKIAPCSASLQHLNDKAYGIFDGKFNKEMQSMICSAWSLGQFTMKKKLSILDFMNCNGMGSGNIALDMERVQRIKNVVTKYKKKMKEQQRQKAKEEEL